MSKPRKLGIKSGYIPNSKADMHFRKNIYQRGREIAERDPEEIYNRRAKRRKKYITDEPSAGRLKD